MTAHSTGVTGIPRPCSNAAGAALGLRASAPAALEAVEQTQGLPGSQAVAQSSGQGWLPSVENQSRGPEGLGRRLGERVSPPRLRFASEGCSKVESAESHFKCRLRRGCAVCSWRPQRQGRGRREPGCHSWRTQIQGPPTPPGARTGPVSAVPSAPVPCGSYTLGTASPVPAAHSREKMQRINSASLEPLGWLLQGSVRVFFSAFFARCHRAKA